MSRAKTSRMRKVDELIREVLADEIGRLKDPRVGFVTVTGVETSRDLRRATVFYSVLGSEEEQVATAKALEHAAPHLQSRLARQVRIKYTPLLEFEVDASIEQGVRISKILHDLAEEHDHAGEEE